MYMYIYMYNIQVEYFRHLYGYGSKLGTPITWWFILSNTNICGPFWGLNFHKHTHLGGFKSRQDPPVANIYNQISQNHDFLSLKEWIAVIFFSEDQIF
jgi:hypothetical protein